MKCHFQFSAFKQTVAESSLPVKSDLSSELKSHSIKFRPNKPASPHLNGKVDCSQKLIKQMVILSIRRFASLLTEWQHYYNREMPHSTHHGKTPMERYFEMAEQTHYSEEIQELYEPTKEPLQEQNYRLELELRRLKRAL